LTPPKLQQLLQPLSAKTGLAPEILSQLARAYYGHVQAQLSSLDILNLDVPGLGVFVLKPKALERKILKTKGLLEKVKQRTSLRSFQIAQNMQQDLDQLLAIQLKHQQDQKRKLKIRQRRYENTDQHLSEPIADS
jgi:hypothetical protein